MAKLSRKVGATSQIFQVFIQDSSSTTGAGLTGLVFNSGSLSAYFHRDTDTTATAISLVTMTSGTFTSSGFVQVDATNMPGLYEFCPPNTALASGASSVVIMLKGASNMAPVVLEIDLDAQVDVTFWNGTVVATPATAGIPDVNAKNINNVATTSVTTINANQGTTQPLNFTGTAGSALVKSDMVDVAGAAVSTTTAQIGVNAVQINGQTTSAAGTVTFPGTVASTTNITAGTITTVTNLTNAPTAGDFTATMKTSLNAATPASVTGAVGSVTGNVGGNVTGSVGSVVGAVGSVTGNVGGNVTGTVGSVVGAVGSVTGNVGGNVTGTVASVVGNVGGNVTGSVGSVTAAVTVSGASTLTESYAAQGAGLTLAQALYQLVQQTGQMSIASTTMTVKKRDATTTAKTFTLNDAVTPTAISETT